MPRTGRGTDRKSQGKETCIVSYGSQSLCCEKDRQISKGKRAGNRAGYLSFLRVRGAKLLSVRAALHSGVVPERNREVVPLTRIRESIGLLYELT